MNKIILLPALLMFILSPAGLAWAEDSCVGTCPEGQVLVGFLDGNTTNCLCVTPNPDSAQPADETPPEDEPAA